MGGIMDGSGSGSVAKWWWLMLEGSLTEVGVIMVVAGLVMEGYVRRWVFGA